MKQAYTGLFEDELKDLFRELKKGDYILFNGTEYHACPTIYYDGIIVHDKDMFLIIDHGMRSYINTYYLSCLLAHKDFVLSRT